MIESKRTRQNCWNRNEVKKLIGDEATVDDLLTHICGDADGHIESDFVLYRYDRPSRTVFHRFNLLWIWPVFLVIAPICWLLRGKIGVSRNSRIGRAVDWLVSL